MQYPTKSSSLFQTPEHSALELEHPTFSYGPHATSFYSNPKGATSQLRPTASQPGMGLQEKLVSGEEEPCGLSNHTPTCAFKTTTPTIPPCSLYGPHREPSNDPVGLKWTQSP